MSDLISDVNDADFEREVLQGDRPVVVDFWAPWCGPCRRMEPALDELAAAHSGVRFVKLNVDENMATGARYEVFSIPTLAVFQGGQQVKRLVGSLSKSKLEAELAPWLGGVPA